MPKRIWWCFGALLFCAALLLMTLPQVERADAAYRASARPVILIDPGHGGLTNTIH